MKYKDCKLSIFIIYVMFIISIIKLLYYLYYKYKGVGIYKATKKMICDDECCNSY